MHQVSKRFNDSVRVSHEIATTLTVEPVGGVETQIAITGGSVTLTTGTGPRYQADLAVTAIDKSGVAAAPGVPGEGYGEGPFGFGSYGGGGAPGSSGIAVGATATYPLISGEGALFRLAHGIKYGSTTELVPMGLLVSTTVPGPLFAGTYQVRLTDQWASLEEAEFIFPFQAPAGPRSTIIAARVTAVIPDVEIVDLSTNGGGMNPGEAVWQTSRTQLIRDMARDGALECYFDGLGRFVIRDEPALQAVPPGGSPQFVLTTGDVGTILEAKRERVMTPRYNVVVVEPTGEQTWPAQVIGISDPDNPRSNLKIGIRPRRITAPTAADATAAWRAGYAELQRLLKLATLREVRAISHAGIEPGDIGAMRHEPTPTDSGINESVIARAIKFDLTSGLMDISMASAGLVEVA